MPNATVMMYVRWILTVALTVTSALYLYYPHWVWIPVTISVLGTLGIHVVPTVSQPQTNPFKGQ